MIKVENGIPLPAKQSGRGVLQLDPRRPRPARFTGLTAALLRMELGQSLLLRGVRSAQAHPLLKHAAASGRDFAVRQMRRGTRVWLVGFFNFTEVRNG